MRPNVIGWGFQRASQPNVRWSLNCASGGQRRGVAATGIFEPSQQQRHSGPSEPPTDGPTTGRANTPLVPCVGRASEAATDRQLDGRHMDRSTEQTARTRHTWSRGRWQEGPFVARLNERTEKRAAPRRRWRRRRNRLWLWRRRIEQALIVVGPLRSALRPACPSKADSHSAKGTTTASPLTEWLWLAGAATLTAQKALTARPPAR